MYKVFKRSVSGDGRGTTNEKSVEKRKIRGTTSGYIDNDVFAS